MVQQAEHFGARMVYDEVVEVDFSKGSPFYIKTYGAEYEAEAVIVTAGASPRRLGIPGEEEFIGRGVSYCGTCDGFCGQREGQARFGKNLRHGFPLVVRRLCAGCR